MPALFTLNYARVQFFLLDNLAQPVLTPEQAIGREILLANCEAWLNAQAIATGEFERVVSLGQYSGSKH